MSIGILCRCGERLREPDNPVPYLADFLTDQLNDAYSGAIEDAIRDHPSSPEVTVAFAMDATFPLFRQAWQCPACGRLMVLGPDRKYHTFVPETEGVPRNVLAAGGDD